MLPSGVEISFTGVVDQARLTRLRSLLRLEPQGRFDDAWDQIQGCRVDEVRGGRIELMLFRDDLDGPWSVTVNTDGAADLAALRAIVAEVTAALPAGDLTAGEIKNRHALLARISG